MFKVMMGGLVAAVLCVTVDARVAAAENISFSGMLTKIDGQMLVVKSESGEQKVKIEPGTRIVMNGKPMQSSDLKVGQQVKCDCEKRGNDVVCVTLEVAASL